MLSGRSGRWGECDRRNNLGSDRTSNRNVRVRGLRFAFTPYNGGAEEFPYSSPHMRNFSTRIHTSSSTKQLYDMLGWRPWDSFPRLVSRSRETSWLESTPVDIVFHEDNYKKFLGSRPWGSLSRLIIAGPRNFLFPHNPHIVFHEDNCMTF